MSKTVILFMDDQEIRHEIAEKYLSKNYLLLHAYTADEAIQILTSYQSRIGVAMLDHDLFDFMSEDGKKVPFEYEGKKIEKNGVYFLNRMFNDIQKDKWPVRYIIHSHNHSGSKNMITDLLALEQTVEALPFSGETLAKIANALQSN